MKGKLYGVGVGPGDPKLMTYKAVETIQKCQVVAVPKSGNSEQVALNIAKEFIKNQTLIDCYMPMIRDKQALRKQHEEVVSEFKGYLDKGDPTIYSTYMYIHRLIKEMGYETEIIPGISSICSVAAALNDSLCEGSDCLHIIPASYKGKEDYLDLEGTKVLMKTGKSMEKVKQHLKEKGLYERARAVECASMPNEKIHESLDTVEESSYFSVIVVKER